MESGSDVIRQNEAGDILFVFVFIFCLFVFIFEEKKRMESGSDVIRQNEAGDMDPKIKLSTQSTGY